MSAPHSAANKRLPRALALKRVVATALRARVPAALVRRITKGIITTHGLRIDTNAPSIADATRAALFWGFYESAERRLIRRNPPTAPVIVDLGASLGVVSAAAAMHLPDGGQLFCVEANPELIALATRNVTRNAPDAHVNVMHGAIDYSSPAGDQVRFSQTPQHVASALADDGAGFLAPVVRLRDVVPGKVVFDLLCDIEGAEVGLLLEEREVLARCRHLYIEVHRCEYGGRLFDVEDIHGLILSHGFELLDRYGNSSVWLRNLIDR